MLKKYIDYVKNDFLEDEETKKLLLFTFLITSELEAMKSHIPDWKDLIQTISNQEMFDKVGAHLVCSDKGLTGLKFLIKECNYDFKEIVGYNQSSLLHKACLHNSLNTVKFLLQSGFSPNQKDVSGLTPLHCAVHANNKELILLLHRHKANINAQDSTGFTPLHLGVIYSCHTSIAALRQLKADIKHKNNLGLDYLGLSKAITSGKLQVSQHNQHKIYIKEKQEQLRSIEGVSEFFKALFNKKLVPQKFENVKKSIETALKLSEKSFYPKIMILKILADCTLLSKSLEAKQLIKYLNYLTHTYKIPKEELIILCIFSSHLINIKKFDAYEQIIDFTNKIINSLNPEELTHHTLSMIYNDITHAYRSVFSYNKAIQAGLMGLKHKLPNENDAVVAYLHYNLANAYKDASNLKPAFKHFKSAYELLKNDFDISNAYLTELIDRKKYSLALEIAANFENRLYSKITSTYLKVLNGEISYETGLQEATKGQYSKDNRSYIFALDLQTLCYNGLSQRDELLNSIKRAYEYPASLATSHSENGYYLFKYVNNVVSYGFEEDGLKFIEEIKTTHPRKNQI